MKKNMIEMEEKKMLLVKIIVISVILVVVTTSFIKNKIDEAKYDEVYNNLLVENIIIEDLSVEESEDENYIKVYVTGAVNIPGVIKLEERARIEDAINLAGGVREDANLEDVNLAYCLEDGQKLYIPNINEKEVEYIFTENGEKVVEGSTNSSNSKVNINTSGVEDLKSLPGVGDSLAQRIISYREENGKFKTIDDLKNVSGIGEKKFESMKDYVTVK